MKRVELKISNKAVYTMLSVLIVVLSGFVVYALSPGTAPNPGHDLSAVSPPVGCTTNQFLKFDGNDWVCEEVGAGISFFLDLLDTPSSFVANNYLAVNSAGNAIEFVDAPSSSGSGTEYIAGHCASGTYTLAKNYGPRTCSDEGSTCGTSCTAPGTEWVDGSTGAPTCFYEKWQGGSDDNCQSTICSAIIEESVCAGNI